MPQNQLKQTKIQRKFYFLPHISSTTDIQCNKIVNKKKIGLNKDQSFPSINIPNDNSPNQLKSNPKNGKIKNGKSIQNPSPILRKNNSQKKMNIINNIQKKRREPLLRKIDSFNKVYTNQNSVNKSVKQLQESPTMKKQPVNINTLTNSPKNSNKLQEKIIKGGQLAQKLDAEQNYYTENSALLSKKNETTSPVLKIGQSQGIMQNLKIKYQQIIAVPKKNSLQNRVVTFTTQQGYSTVTTKISGQANYQTKKQDLQLQINRLQQKLQKKTFPVAQQRFYQSLDKNFKDKKSTIDQFEKSRCLDDHQDKVTELNKKGMRYRQQHMEFQQILLQLKLHKNLATPNLSQNFSANSY